MGKEPPTEDETRRMADSRSGVRNNETRYRAALITEDTERREAGARAGRPRGGGNGPIWWQGSSCGRLRLHWTKGRTLDGRTAEVVQELRAQGGFRGVPVPWQALEVRTGETVAGGTPDPMSTRPIIGIGCFLTALAGRMGAQMISIDSGAAEWPVVTSSVTAGWADGETANVAGPTAYATTGQGHEARSQSGRPDEDHPAQP